MSIIAVFAVFLASCLALVSAGGDVVTLKEGDFQDKLKEYDIALVKFYAPWCGHCKRLAPEFEKAATVLKLNDPPVVLAELDCTAEKAICDKFGVSGYPTLKVFKRGEFAFEYGGEREADGIVKYMRSKAGPTSKALTTLKEVDKFLSSNDYVVVGFFDKEGNSAQNSFTQFADSLSDTYRFGYVIAPSEEILAKYKYQNAIVAFQPKVLNSKFEPSAFEYTGDLTVHKLKEWISGVVAGLCGHRTQGNADVFKAPVVVVYYNVDYTKDPKGSNYWRNRVMKVAEKMAKEDGAKKRVQFAVSNAQELESELGEMGLEAPKGKDAKPVVGARDAQNRKFKMTDEFTPENLEKFVNDFLGDKLEPYLKSEPVPETNDDPVKVVVAKTFDEIVNDPTKDVLIEFYAPWCGHCKALAPKYEELAKKMKDEPNLVIAKMDATANDVPKPYEVQGFPTLYFAPKGKKTSPVQYHGEREVKNFVEFLAKESTDQLEGFDRSGKPLKKAKKSEL